MTGSSKTKAELIAEIEASWSGLEAALERLSQEQKSDLKDAQG